MIFRLTIAVAALAAVLFTGSAGAGSPAVGDPPLASAPPPSASPVVAASPITPPAALAGSGCDLTGGVQATGTFQTAAAYSTQADKGQRTYSVEVERGLPIDAACFAAAVDSILNDPRSWAVGFHRVDADAEIVVRLAAPSTVDELCWPLDTGGMLSCASGTSANLNYERWVRGAESYDTDVDGYRTYLVNHEVGHLLGLNHVGCPDEGEPAPVMMQQTKGVDGCVAQPWPLASERP